jgi:hypothetical protein
LVTGLIAQFTDLTLCFLADGGAVDQLLPLPLAGRNDLVGLLAGLANEILPLTD